MQLSMTVLRCPDQVAPEARTVTGGEFHVGRGPDVDWVLPDPDRLLSKRHFAVAFRGGGWQVADTSTNGTYLNTEPDSIGRGATRALRDGDRLRLGAYEIEVRLVDQPAQADFNRAPTGGFGAGASGRSGQSPFGDPFASDPLAPPPPTRRPFDAPAYHDLGIAPTGAQLPHDFDPLAPDRDDQAFGGGFRGPVQSDHSSAMDDAIIPPPIAGYAAPHQGGLIPGDDLLPDDWDKDLLEGIAPPSQSPAGPAPSSQAPSSQAPSSQAPSSQFAAPPARPIQASPREATREATREAAMPPLGGPAMSAPAAFAQPEPHPLSPPPAMNMPPPGGAPAAQFTEQDFADLLDPLAPPSDPRHTPPPPEASSSFEPSPFEASPFEASPFGAPPFGAPHADAPPPAGARPGGPPPGAPPFGAPYADAPPPAEARPGGAPHGASPFGAPYADAPPPAEARPGGAPHGASLLGTSPLGTSPLGASPLGSAPQGGPSPRPDPLDFSDPLAPPSAPMQAPQAIEPAPIPSMVAAPVVRQREPRPATPRAGPSDADPFADLDAGQAFDPRPAAPTPTQPAPAAAASPFDEPADLPPRSAPPPAARPAKASPPAMDDGSALAAFFKGADLGGAAPADPISMMTGLGQAFRALVSGLRQVLIARATIKGEFRIEQTMIRARGNNPLKFSANDDDALTALLGVGRRTDMAPAAAIEDSLRDLRLHELATMAAMQVAVRALLDELSPDKIRAGTDQGGMAVLPAQRKARAWDAFEARHASVVRALVDDFDSIFGKSFARAYERALDEISLRERQ